MASLPGTEGDPNLAIDPKKRKRMISNRESARRSRMKKQQRLEDLTNQVEQLKAENARILNQVNLHSEKYLKVEGDNTVLRTQVMELTERLWSLNSILKFVEEFSGLDMDIPEIPDQLLKPWQLPCPAAQPITTSSNMSQF